MSIVVQKIKMLEIIVMYSIRVVYNSQCSLGAFKASDEMCYHVYVQIFTIYINNNEH